MDATSDDTPFPFKFKAHSGRVHRLRVTASAGIGQLVANVIAKLGSEVDDVGGEAVVVDGTLGTSGFALSYLDDEGDTVSITTDRDLLDAISLARQGGRDKVDLFVHDPTKPPLSATVEPKPVIVRLPTPPASTVRNWSRQATVASDGRDTDETPAKARTLDIIPGVSNDLLIPGAIAALAVVLIGVFALGRTSSNR